LLKNIIFLITLFSVLNLQAQLGFCTGNSGDPIFIEDFGVGYRTDPLPSGSTTYKFTSDVPRDGSYKVSSNTKWFGWFWTDDHTPNDKNGRSLIVNASNTPGEFFRIPVSGLCENTTYEFSSWLINLFPSSSSCGTYESPRPINVTFEIWDSTNKTILKSGNTGNIYSSRQPNWQQYGLVFQTRPGQTSVILKMRNNGTGGCGNDLAIDDIVFRTCGDAVVIENSLKKRNNISIEENDLPYSTKLTAIPDFSVFSTHFYQWQKSKDGVNWSNISGENKNTFLLKNIKEITYYRVLIAEDAINLLNTSCNSSSDIYKVNIIASKKPKKEKPPIVRKKVAKIKAINSKEITKINTPNLDKLIKPEKQPLKVDIISVNKNLKTEKEVIIVRDGIKIIKHKVWIYGVPGRFVQTGEKIIKKGSDGAGFRIKETIYTKAFYGYNSTTRIYFIDKNI
jgi:hypothetical protein